MSPSPIPYASPITLTLKFQVVAPYRKRFGSSTDSVRPQPHFYSSPSFHSHAVLFTLELFSFPWDIQRLQAKSKRSLQFSNKCLSSSLKYTLLFKLARDL